MATQSKPAPSAKPAKPAKGKSAALHAPLPLEAEKLRQTNALVAAIPFNTNKAGEYGFDNGTHAAAGTTVKPQSRLPGGSTLTEASATAKTGGVALEGINAAIGPLDRVRVDSSGQVLTTN